MITVCLKLEKETKHTFRFKARDPQVGEPPAVVDTIYINKRAFNYGPAPKKIVVTVEETIAEDGHEF